MNIDAKTAHELVTGRKTRVRIPITRRLKPQPGNDEIVRPVHIDQVVVTDDDGTETTYDLRQVGKAIGRVLILQVVTHPDDHEWELCVRPTDTVLNLAPADRPAHFDPDDDHDDPAIHGYTTAASSAIDAGAHVDPKVLHPDWSAGAELRRQEVQRLTRAERAAELEQLADQDPRYRRHVARLDAALAAAEREARSRGRAA